MYNAKTGAVKLKPVKMVQVHGNQENVNNHLLVDEVDVDDDLLVKNLVWGCN